MAYESSVFSLDLDDAVSTIYSGKLRGDRDGGAGDDDEEEGRGRVDPAEAERNRVVEFLQLVGFRLATALVALNEYPYIRHTKSEATNITALALAKALNAYRKANPGWRPWGSPRPEEEEDISLPGRRQLGVNEPAEPATVIIVDRVDDIAAALLHDTTYSVRVGGGAGQIDRQTGVRRTTCAPVAAAAVAKMGCGLRRVVPAAASSQSGAALCSASPLICRPVPSLAGERGGIA
jgi:hypothetical protein